MLLNVHPIIMNRLKKLMRLLLMATFIGSVENVQAQTKEIDSLQNRVDTETGTNKVDAINALAFQIIETDNNRANDLFDQAKKLAEKLKYTKGLSEAIIFQGLYKIGVGNTKEGLMLLKIGREKAKQSGNFGWEGYALVQMGNTYRGQGQYDSAKFWYDQSYLVLKDSLNPWHLSVLYKNLSSYYGLTSRPKQELSYLFRSLAIREKLSDKLMLADVLTVIAHWYLNQSNQEEATKYLLRAERYVNSQVPSEVKTDIQYQRAIIYFKQADYKKALDLFNEVKGFYLGNSNLQRYVKTLIDVAELLEEMGNYDISLKNGFEALKLCEEKNYLNDAVRAQLIIGRNYYRIKQPKAAHDFAFASLQQARKNHFEAEEAAAYNLEGLILKSEKKYEDALFNFEKALEIRKHLNDRKGTGVTLANISETYEQKGNLKPALVLQYESLAIKESILHQSGLAWGYLDLGSIYTKLKDFGNAQLYLSKAEEKARYMKSGTILVNVYQTRRDLLMAQGKLNEALNYSILYEQMRDSVNSSAITNRVLSLQSVYDLEKKDQEIELLNKTKQVQEDEITIQKNRIQRQQFFIAAIVLGLILLTILAYTFYMYFNRMKRLNAEVQERNEEIQAQSEELSESNASLTTLNQQLAEKQAKVKLQSTELTEANSLLILVNMELAEKNEEMAAQSEELSEANAQFLFLNNELSIKQKELEAQAEELRESYSIISELNESLERKVEERTKEMKQAYKELDTFFYRSSHDFRRPLTTFMGLSEVAKITVKDKNALDLFEKVKETAVNLDRMLIKLQSISDVGAHQFVYREISMQNIYESACDTFREAIDQFGIRVTIQVGVVNSFQSYPAFLKIIVENLVENAIQFRGRKDPFILLSAQEKDEGLQITIQDNGQGIEDEYQSKVFDMFFRGNEQSKGNGLGLYIVKKAVEKLKGNLSIKSTYQYGTTFTVWFPFQLS